MLRRGGFREASCKATSLLAVGGQAAGHAPNQALSATIAHPPLLPPPTRVGEAPATGRDKPSGRGQAELESDLYRRVATMPKACTIQATRL